MSSPETPGAEGRPRGEPAERSRTRGTRPGAGGTQRPNTAAEQAWALMYRFVEANSRRGDLAAALGFRLGAGRGKVLFRLREGPATLRQLASAIGADAPYTTVVVDKLEAHGLVERLPHPEDRRRKLVALTAAGREAIATADAILLRPPSAMGALPAGDLEQLTALLARLLDAEETRAPR